MERMKRIMMKSKIISWLLILQVTIFLISTVTNLIEELQPIVIRITFEYVE